MNFNHAKARVTSKCLGTRQLNLIRFPPLWKKLPECLIRSRKSDIFRHGSRSRQYIGRAKDWAETTDLTQNWNVKNSVLPSAAIRPYDLSFETKNGWRHHSPSIYNSSIQGVSWLLLSVARNIQSICLRSTVSCLVRGSVLLRYI